MLSKSKSSLGFLLFFLTCSSLSAQSHNQVNKLMKQISHVNQLDSLRSQHPKWHLFSEVLTDADSLKYPFLLNPVLGEIRKMSLEGLATGQFLTKIIEVKKEELCRGEYIFLDGEKFSKTQMDSIAREILYLFNSGVDFSELIESYSMDKKSSELGWFNKEMVLKGFFELVFNQYVGSVFPIQSSEVNGMFVVHKTDENIVRNLYTTIFMAYEE